jgi:hypothetical protein
LEVVIKIGVKRTAREDSSNEKVLVKKRAGERGVPFQEDQDQKMEKKGSGKVANWAIY